jgi:hypothetical protein
MLEDGYMKKNVKPVTPICGICKSFYSSRNDDGSGLCLKCRSKHSQPILNVKYQLKQTFVMEVGKTMMDDFEQEEVGATVEEIPEQGGFSSPVDSTDDKVIAEFNTKELKIEDIIEPGRYGVSNSPNDSGTENSHC